MAEGGGAVATDLAIVFFGEADYGVEGAFVGEALDVGGVLAPTADGGSASDLGLEFLERGGLELVGGGG